MVVTTVVKWSTVSQVYQFTLIFIFWHDAATIITNIIVEVLLFCSNMVWHLIRTTFTSCDFYNKNSLAVNLFDKKTRLIVWTNQIVITNHIFLYLFDRFWIDTKNRTNSMPMFFLYTHNNVATTCILKIIGEGTDAAIFLYNFVLPTFRLTTIDL